MSEIFVLKDNFKEMPINNKGTICFLCEEAKGETISLESRCGHNFHSDCIKKSLKAKIYSGSYQLSCPVCNDLISDIDLKKILGGELYEKFEKARAKEELMKSGLNLLECPKCEALFEFPANDQNMIISCQACHHK